MKIQLDRRYPIAMDIGTQLDDSKCDYVFFYDDGGVFRAFACDEVTTNEFIVTATQRDGRIVVTLPADTIWRMVNKSVLEFVTGAEMEESELTNYKAKRDLTKKLVKDLGLKKKKGDPKDEDEDETEPWAQVPVRTGVYA